METNRNNPHAIKCALLLQSCKYGDIFNTTCRNILFQNSSCGRRPRSTQAPTTSDQNDPNITVSLVILLLFISVCSLLSNIFVCLVYVLYKEVRSAKHYFIINLVIADIFIAALAIPFFLASTFFNAPVTLCQIGSVFDVLCCTSSIINFVAISLERFIAIKYPLRYASIVSRRRCLWAIAVVWLYSILTALFSYVPVGDLHFNHCVFFSEPYIITITFTSFLLPLFAMLATYGWIFKIAKYQARQIYNNTPSGICTTVKHEFKAAKILTLIIGVYIVCWFPFFAYICVDIVVQMPATFFPVFYTVQVVRYFNSLANPFIYVGINREFRRKAFKLLKEWTSSRNNDIDFSNRSMANGLQTTIQTSCEDIPPEN